MTQDKPRRRTFKVERPKDASVEFTLTYQEKNLPAKATAEQQEAWNEDAEDAWRDGKSVIRCVRRAPGQLLLDFLSGDDNESFAAIDRFLAGVIDRRDMPEYRRITTDQDVAVPIETLAEIVAWLVEVYAARPTEPPSDS